MIFSLFKLKRNHQIFEWLTRASVRNKEEFFYTFLLVVFVVLVVLKFRVGDSFQKLTYFVE